MKGVDIDIKYVEKASRMELLWRIGYYIVFAIIGMIFGCIAMLCFELQFLVILILGKRLEIFNKVIHAFIKWYASFISYLWTLSDERPEIMPKL